LLVIGVSTVDIILSVIYTLIILLFARIIRKSVCTPATKKYFVLFIFLKVVYAIFFVLLHAYYYKGGDTFLYFAGAKFVATQIAYDPTRAFSFLFGGIEVFEQVVYTGGFLSYAFRDPSTISMFQITTLFYYLGFKQIMATTILMSAFSAIGVWSIFSVFCKLYPKAIKLFAWGTLFYPTLCIWGSGILKDTIIIFAIGLMFKSFYQIRNKQKITSSIIMVFFGSLICMDLKPYILYSFLPPMLLWQYSAITSSLKNRLIRYSIAPFILISFMLAGFYFLNSISENAGKYSLNNIQEMAEGFQSWHNYLAENRGQTGYSLGEVNYTPIGVLSKSPQAFFVTFYRPLPFEISNIATAFESIQSTILLFLTLFLIIKIGLINIFKNIFKNTHVRSFLLFSIIMGIATGITSFNYGALSRYKIPILPFYTAALAILYIEGKKVKAKKLYV